MITLWLTGLPGSGKTTLARALAWHIQPSTVRLIDGDRLRAAWPEDPLGFSRSDRARQTMRAVARAWDWPGVAIVSLVSPWRLHRAFARDLLSPGFLEVHVATPAAECERRRPDLWARGRSGEIPLFTGVSDPYEAPEAPEVTVYGDGDYDADRAVAAVLSVLSAGLPQPGDAAGQHA